jgi:serine/threonine protein kinase
VTTGSFAAGLVGVVLDGRYRLDALLGEGGMGSVFRAQHLAMDRRVAVKLLKPHLTQDSTASARFLREARATMKVDSPHVVKIFDFGITPHGDYYMALEYLDGRTVQRELDVDGPFAPARVLHIARQVLHGLGAAHRMGLVHRDLKPDNILLLKVGDDADYTKLLDFGVAKLMEGTAVSSQSALQLTQAGMVFGTPEFMSPEQACGHPLDGRSDLYSLAATMFAMLTGCAMFEGKSPIELLTHHVRTPPPQLDELLQKCLSKKREDRPATAEEMDQQIAQLQTYVKRGGAAAASSNRALRTPSQMSSSAYFQALPPELVEPGATLLPAQPSRASSPTMEPPSSSGVHETRGASRDAHALGAHASGIRAPMGTDAVPVASRGRGAILAVIALAVLATIAVAIVLVTRKKDTNGSKVVATNGSNTNGSNPTTDAGESVRPPDTTEVAPSQFLVDAGVAVAPIDAGTKTTRDPKSNDPKPTLKTNDPDGPKSKSNEHLKNAEAALRDGNRLRQLAEADLALKADPKNARAKYLLADALIKGGDTDRGCSMLRSLGRNTLATTRAKAANCP